MQEITHLLNRYREAARVLWNNFFVESEVGFDAVEEFDAIRSGLFQALVLQRVPAAAGKGGAGSLDRSRFILEPLRPFEGIRIVPVADKIPIHVRRAGTEIGYWDADPKQIDRSQAELLYVDCFDWDVRGYREFHYYRVEIRNFKDRSDLEGRPALLSVEHGRAYAVTDPTAKL